MGGEQGYGISKDRNNKGENDMLFLKQNLGLYYRPGIVTHYMSDLP